MTYLELIRSGKDILDNNEINDSLFDARMILMHLTGTDLSELVLKYHDEVPKKEEEEYFEMIDKRASHYPLQYITGKAAFMDFEFFVSEAVLIPRQDTEVLVSEVVSFIKQNEALYGDTVRVFDICTGSGCIGISVYKYLTDMGKKVELTLSDISEEALKVCKKNCEKYGIKCDIVQSDMFENVERKEYDLILSNPPYIRTGDVSGLMPEVAHFEPEIALNGREENEDGLYYYRIIAYFAYNYLSENGKLFMEIGFDEADDVCCLLASEGYRDISVIKDLAGLDRVVSATDILQTADLHF